LLIGCQVVPAEMQNPELKSECVVLLHGLARTSLSMQIINQALLKRGYSVVNINYPSRQLPIAELATFAIEQGILKCRKKQCKKIHFVTHSLGGILVRHYTQSKTIPNMHRVVMLGPPNQGSEIVDRLKKLPGYSQVQGPAGLELGTADEDTPKQLGPVNFELGIIAGKRSINPFLSSLIPGQDDGKVSVESTKTQGMKDFITLPITHTFMMWNPESIHQTLHFLEHGSFDHKVEPIND